MFFKTVGEENYSDVMIPSLFFDLYIPIASGDQIKVYLLGYKSAFLYRGFQNDGLDNRSISSTLNIPEETVIDIWRYWDSMGVVKVHDKNGDFSVEFLDIKTEHLNKNKKKSISDDLEDSLYDANTYEYVNMYNKIESLAGRMLIPSEKIDILKSSRDYKMSPDMVVEAFERAISDHGRIKSIKYVMGILKSWFDQSIHSIDDLEILDMDRADKNKNYKAVFKALSFNRKPTSYEKDTMNKWFYEYNMSMDVILKACEKSINTNNPNIKYFDAIIRSWYDKGINTVEAVENEDKNFAKNKFKKSSNTSSANKLAIKTKFHNFKPSSSEKYSDESLSKLLRKSTQIKKSEEEK